MKKLGCLLKTASFLYANLFTHPHHYRAAKGYTCYEQGLREEIIRSVLEYHDDLSGRNEAYVSTFLATVCNSHKCRR